MSQRSRNFCYTINNPTQLDDPFLWSGFKYNIYGKEVGKCGTPHYQGFVVFKLQKTLSACKKVNPRAHWEIAKDVEAAIKYCKKEDDFHEMGVKPMTPHDKGKQEKEKWDNIKKLAQQGRLDEIDSSVYVRHYGTLKRIARDNLINAPSIDDVCGLWIYGESGTGKSHYVRTTYPDAYQKPVNKWWDGYQQQEIVHLDEVAPTHATWIASYLKCWADKWSFPAETKGSTISIRPKMFIITSNYSIDDMGFDPVDVPAIKRRFKEKQFKKTNESKFIEENKENYLIKTFHN